MVAHGLHGAGFDPKVVPASMARELSMLAAPALSVWSWPAALLGGVVNGVFGVVVVVLEVLLH